MPATVLCARSSLPHQGPELAQLPIQHQLQQRHQHSNRDVLAVPHMLIEDEVHGVIEIPSHIKEIVNHGLFQRLKRVKQLGFLPLAVVPSANHTRYEHCIGTYKSAQDLLKALKRNSNYERELPEWCKQAVEIAALLHDVGHGPFSHSWERACGESFSHEKNGLICVDKIFADMTSQELRSLRDDENGRGVQLIKALIVGKSDLLTYPMMGHGYIFDIVNNDCCGLDVDKWDYLRRDNKRLKLLSEEEMKFDDIFLKARVSQDGQRIEYRYEDYHLIYRLYVARWRLHIEAYQLPKAIAFDTVLRKILQRSKRQLLAVRADSDEWLELYDERVLELIDSDPLTVYLHSPERFVETTSSELNSPDCVCVKREKLGPGVDMNSDMSYPLYGDKSKQRIVDRLITPTPITACFRLL